MRSPIRKILRVRWRARVSAAAWVVLALALQACTLVQYRPDVAIGTGRPGGVYLPLGDSICRVFNLDLPQRGLRCAAYPSRGPVANIEALHDGRIDIGIVQSDVLADALRGHGPFASRGPDKALRVLFTGQTEAFTIVARRELEIRAATELRGKRINLGSPGSGERVSMERVMAALGFAPTDFAETREFPLAQQHDAFCANALDAKLDQYSDISRKIAKELKLPLCDLRGAFVEHLKAHNKDNAEKGVLTTDRVHLNQAGNEFVAKTMLKVLGSQ